MIAGHNRYYQALRADLASDSVLLYRAGRQDLISYKTMVPYADWMESANLVMDEDLCGCCSKELLSSDDLLTTLDFRPRVFEPEWAYITPPAEVKTRALSGSAYIDFPVNRTELYPDYRRNPDELAAIRKTIDHVRNDADITIDSLSVIGYASPEGPYDNNVRLAAGRTATLIGYVRDLYSFPQSILRKGSVPEDWAGLEKRLLLTDIANRDAILSIVRDTTIEPDARDWKIRREFPVQYQWMLREIYPALRHSDYTVHYTVVDYTDPEKIGQILRTEPQKLSLGEMFTYANTLDPESDEFREVFEVAVRMYPDSPVANLNAANTALRHKDFKAADAYLAKAGDSADADYLRGVAQAMQQNYTGALPLLEKAAAAGFAKASEAISQLVDKKLIEQK